MSVTVDVAYIVSNFPCYSESFILKELVELSRRGCRLSVFSLRSRREEIVRREAAPFLPHTFYSPFLLASGLWRAQAHFLFHRPKTYLNLLCTMVRRCWRKPGVLLKNLAVFPKSVRYARFLSGSGVRHIHAHFANYPATSAWIVSRLLDLPFSFTVHAHDLFVDDTMLDVKIECSARTFVISRFNRDYILSRHASLDASRIAVHRCGVDVEEFALRQGGGLPSPPRILAVGRLFPKKGFSVLIDACANLKGRGVPFRCTIVGEGPEEGRLRRRLRRLGLEGEVDLPGPLVDDALLRLFRDAAVFAAPSVRASDREIMDGIPVVLMEAMAMGIPVVSTRVSGIPELVEEGVTGLTVEPGDVGALAEALDRMLADSALVARLSRSGRERIEREFNARLQAEALLGFFLGAGERT